MAATPGASAGEPGLPFQPIGVYDQGCGPRILAADIDGDGNLDLVCPEYRGSVGSGLGRVAVRHGDGSGRFGPERALYSKLVADLEIADLNEDGAPDIVATESGRDRRATVVVLLNDGSGDFATTSSVELPERYGLPEYPDLGTNYGPEVEVGDADGDGNPDALVRSVRPEGSGMVGLLPSDGAGHLGALSETRVAMPPTDPDDYGYATFFSDMTSGDFDGDGRTDLAFDVVLNDLHAVGHIVEMHGESDGSFAQVDTSSPSQGPQELNAVDLNGDGRDDLVSSGTDLAVTGEGLAVRLSTATDLTTPAFPTGTAPYLAHFTIDDFDQDRQMDIFGAPPWEDPGPRFLRGAGDGTFDTFGGAGSSQSYGVASGDFDDDGYPDIARLTSEYDAEAGQFLFRLEIDRNTLGTPNRLGLKIDGPRGRVGRSGLLQHGLRFRAKCGVDCRVTARLSMEGASGRTLASERTDLRGRGKAMVLRIRSWGVRAVRRLGRHEHLILRVNGRPITPVEAPAEHRHLDVRLRG
ncbi:MAG: VCBS repeat-containing protein [Solirubrobacterales bacterium]